MLGCADALELPAGVRLDGAALADDVVGARYPANHAALFVLRRTGRPLGEIAEELASTHGIALEQARTDVLRFAFALNHEQLVNVVPGDGVARRVADWLRIAACLLPAGSLPSANRRRSGLDTSTPSRAALGALRALARRSLLVTGAAVVLAAPGGLTPGVVVLGLGVGIGLAVHEAGHAAFLAGIGAALVVSGARTYVIHRPLTPRRRRAVAAAGPGVTAALGVAAVATAWLAGVPDAALAGCPAAAHAAGLTVATGDGRAACGL